MTGVIPLCAGPERSASSSPHRPLPAKPNRMTSELQRTRDLFGHIDRLKPSRAELLKSGDHELAELMAFGFEPVTRLSTAVQAPDRDRGLCRHRIDDSQ